MMTKLEKRWFDFPALLTLIAALLVAASRLSATEWTADLNMAATLSLIAAVLGAALGYTRFHGRLVFLIGTVFTFFFVTWQAAQTVGAPATAWSERVASFFGRIGAALALFARNQPSDDPLLFLTSMALLYWLIAIVAGYQLIRYGKPWQAVITAGVVLMIVDLYSPGVPRSSLYSGAFVVLVLLLLAQVYYLHSKEHWSERGIAVDGDTEFNLGRSALMGALVLVLVAWNMPSVILAFSPGSVQQKELSDMWQSIRQRIENATASLEGPLAVEQDSFGEELGLGTGNPLSDELVFTVKSSLVEQPPGVVYYWRARSYDTYVSEEDSWTNKPADELAVSANADPIDYPDWTGRRRVRFTIHAWRNLGSFYSPALPLVISRPAQMLVAANEAQELDVLSLDADPPIRGGETYEVLSWISTPTVYLMRTSSTDYPEWIRERYLDLPDDLPQRVIDLAVDIAGQADNPYDKAALITQFLRENITYQSVIPPTPDGRHPIDYFLFDSRTGFCNYYASAEVLMLRAVGVPARLAVGYAQGEYNENTQQFEVRRLQRHAWPEVYFEGLGWVEFEPTVSQPEILRLTGSEAQDLAGPRAIPLADGNTLERALRDNEIEEAEVGSLLEPEPAGFPWWIVGAVGVALAAGGAAFYLIKRRPERSPAPLPAVLEATLTARGWAVPAWLKRWAYRTRLSPIERAFLTVEQALSLLGRKPDVAATPREEVDALIEVLPAAKEPATLLLGEFQRALYSRHPVDQDRARLAGRQIRSLALRAWVEKILNSRPASPFRSSAD